MSKEDNDSNRIPRSKVNEREIVEMKRMCKEHRDDIWRVLRTLDARMWGILAGVVLLLLAQAASFVMES